MPRRRVTPLDHDEALAVCERIKAKHPDILERRADGLYRHQLGSPEMRAGPVRLPCLPAGGGCLPGEAGARDADFDRLRKAFETY